MVAVRGFQVIGAVEPEVTYGVEVAATNKLRYISSSLEKTWENIPNEALLGSASQGPPDHGLATVAGDLVVDLDYALENPLLSHFFGSFAAGVYSLEDVIDNTSFTMALGMRVSPYVFTGTKASKLVISGAPGQPMQATYSLFGANRVLTTILNDQTALDSLVEPSSPRMLFHHSASGVWIGDQANALVIGDALKVNNWSLTIDRAMTQFHANTQNAEQAYEDGFQTVELQIELALYESNYFIQALEDHTPLQCRTAFTRGTASKTIRIPNMYVMSAEATASGPGLIPHAVTFSCHNDLAGSNASADMDFSEAVRLYEAAV